MIGDVASYSCGDTSHGKPYYDHMITGYTWLYHKYKQQLIASYMMKYHIP